MLACACNPSISEAEAGLGWSRLYSELEASLGYSIIPCLKKSGGRLLNQDHSAWEIQMQDAWRVLCVEKMGLHILRDSLNKHSLTDWQLIAHCIHGNSGTLLPTDSIFKKYYIFHFNFSAGFRVWSSHSSSMNRKRSNILSAASLSSVPAPNLQDIRNLSVKT